MNAILILQIVPIILAIGIVLWAAKNALEGDSIDTVKKAVPIVLLLMVMVLATQAISDPDGEQDEPPGFTGYTLANGILTITESTPDFPDGSPWAEEKIGLMVVSEGVDALGAYTLTDEDADILFKRVPTMVSDSIPGTMTIEAAGYYIPSSGGYEQIPTLATRLIKYALSGDAYSCVGTTTDIAYPFVLEIPDTYSGLPVKKLSLAAAGLSKCRCIISSSIEVAEANSLYNMTFLRSIIMPSLKETGNNFLRNCMNAAAIHAPSLISLGDFCIYHTAFPRLELNIKNCGSQCLCENPLIKSLTLPKLESCNEIAEYVPELESLDCSSLKTCKGILRSAFAVKSVSLPSLEVVNSRTSSSNYYTSFQNLYNLVELDLPSLKTIKGGAIDKCPMLEKVSMPELESADMDLCSYCKVLKDVYCPKLKTLNSTIFKYTAIEDIKLDALESARIENVNNLKTLSLPNATSLILYATPELQTLSLPQIENLRISPSSPAIREVEIGPLNSLTIISSTGYQQTWTLKDSEGSLLTYSADNLNNSTFKGNAYSMVKQ